MSEHFEFELHGAQIRLPTSTIIHQFLDTISREDQRNFSAELVSTFQPRIGEVWPGEGGVYAGISRGVDGQPDEHLIVPTHASARFSSVKWGPAKEIAGAGADRDGRANTLAMAAAGSKLAEKIVALEIDGHRDFMLPARRDLSLCFANVPELFESECYWSSTQYSAGGAWCQDFGGGSQVAGLKDGQLRALAVRRVQVIR